ncbi:serine hydrolase [Actinopolymorpha sp. B11F2]|uniref:serine hydrolase domain-containing protein n=1 Tax=Actinopolymorpha sp. B11F2 TaxID=3160862 RepID=UPI0032E3E3BC
MARQAAPGAGDLHEVAERSKLSGAALVTWGDQAWEHGDVDAHHVIYSVTKSVISAAILLLAGEGVISLHTPIAAALGDDRFDATPAQLLSHVGGIPDYGPLPAYHAAVYSHPSQPWTDEMLVEQVLAAEPDLRPGRAWAYSNLGYMLLRRILDDHGGLTSLLPALGFSAASVAADLSGFDHAMPAVSARIGDGLHDVRGRYHPAWVAHRTIVTTARELHRFWNRPLGAFHDPATVVPMARNGFGFDQVSWGLGVMVLTDPKSPLGPVVGHGGGGPGYSAAMFAAPSKDALVIVLEPTEDFPAQETALALLRAATT